MTIILLTGMPGAGKEEFLKIAKRKGFDVVRMGDVVREMADKKNISDENIGEFAHEQRKKHHQGIWAERTLEKVKDEKTVIDGIRSPAELNIFQNKTKEKVSLVAIHASEDTRFERIKKRGREDAPDTRKQFEKRDERELSWGLGKVIARADYVIVNESTLSEFRDDVEKYLHFLKDL